MSSPRGDSCSAGDGEPTCPLRGGPFPVPGSLVAAEGRGAHWAEAPQGPGPQAKPLDSVAGEIPPPRPREAKHSAMPAPRVTKHAGEKTLSRDRTTGEGRREEGCLLVM